MILSNKKIFFTVLFLASIIFAPVASATVEPMPEKILQSIEITTPATKLTYYVGDTLDISGLVVTGHYLYLTEDGPIPGDEVIVITESNISGFNSSAPADDQVLTITVDGKTATYTIDILPTPVLKILNITTPATKLTYYVGESLDITGLTLTGIYVYKTEDGEIPVGEKPVEITTTNITGFNSSVPADDQVLTITVDGIFTTYNINIIERTPVLKILNITTPASKLTYYVGDTLDISGLVVAGIYVYKTEDGEIPVGEKVVEIATTNISGFNSSAPADDQVLTITVDGIFTTYTVDIINPAPVPPPDPAPSGGGGGGAFFLTTQNKKTGDINQDNKVDELDFSILMDQWNQSGTSLAADLNKDNIVDEYDFSILMENWGL